MIPSQDSRYAAVYARVSTEDQGKGFSIPTQLDACQKLAEREGYTVPESHVLIDEGISGTTMDRSGLRRLRALVNTKAIGAVIVYDPDRLSRNLGHQLLLTEEMEQAGVKLLIVSHPLEQGPEGWLFFQMRGALAEYERAKILERMQRGRIGRARAGHPHGGQVQLGYCAVREAHAGRWEVVPEEADVVRRIFQMCLCGMPVRAIARQLTVEGVKTRLDRHPQGGGSKLCGEGVWATSSVHRILRYEGYVGRAYYGRWQSLGKTIRRLRPPEEWILITVPAIIPQETFDAAQRQLLQNKVAAKRNRRYEYLLTGGRFRCARCGRSMTGSVTGRGKRRYRCTSIVNVMDVQQRCRGSVLADDVEARVWHAVEEVLQKPELIAAEIRRQHDQSDTMESKLERDMDLVEAALSKCQREDERWTRAYAEEVIELDELKARRADLSTRRQGFEEQRLKLQLQLDGLRVRIQHVDALVNYCSDLRQRLEKFGFEEKRLALQALNIQVTWMTDCPLKVLGSVPLGENVASTQGVAIVSTPSVGCA